MKSLNNLYQSYCKPGYKSYKKITNDITLIENFFDNYSEARNFFISRDKWETTIYQESSKSGNESLFPPWVGKSLLEKYIFDNKIIDNSKSYEVVCNFLYNDNKNYIWSISNSGYFPHYDYIQYDDNLNYICLVNLNNIPVHTNFYTFKNLTRCCNKNIKDWEDYQKKIKEQLIEFYNKDTITRYEFKKFLDEKKYKDLKIVKSLKYDPNQAIIYPADLFHCPDITDDFTIDNPRCLLRIQFSRNMLSTRNISYT